MDRETIVQLDKIQKRLDAIRATEVGTDIISPFLALPGLRGFWPMSSAGANGNALDLSGQGRTLTYNGNPTYNYDGSFPYIDLDGTGDYLSRADEAGFDITGTETIIASDKRGLFIAGTFRFDDAIPASNEQLIGKWTGGQLSYRLLRTTSSTILFGVSSDGSTPVFSTAISVTKDQWYVIEATFDPSSLMRVRVNEVVTERTSGVPASIFNGTANFTIGADSGGGNRLNGQAGPCALSAMYFSDDLMDGLFDEIRGAAGV